MKVILTLLFVAMLATSSVSAQVNIPINTILGKSQTTSKIDCADCAGVILTWEAKPSKDPIEYTKSSDNTPPSQFSHIVESNSLVGIMLLDGSNIVYEKYYPDVLRETQVLSLSRAKSLTSIALGKAFCSGKILSLSENAEKYSSEFNNTVYGKSKITSLLEMSSGASTGLPHGDVVAGEAVRWLQGAKSQSETLRQYTSEFFTGEGTYKYKNQDPAVISHIIHEAYKGDFEQYLQKNIWDTVRAKSPAIWALDKRSIPIGSSFMMITTGDWGRLGIYVNSILRKDIKDDCMLNYLNNATQAKKRTGIRLFQGYGYFFWTNHMMDRKNEIIWMVGLGGQLVAMHPPTKKVMVYNSLSDINIDAVSAAFVRWVYP